MKLMFNSVTDDLNKLFYSAQRENRSIKNIVLTRDEFDELKKECQYQEGSSTCVNFRGIPIEIESVVVQKDD